LLGGTRARLGLVEDARLERGVGAAHVSLRRWSASLYLLNKSIVVRPTEVCRCASLLDALGVEEVVISVVSVSAHLVHAVDAISDSPLKVGPLIRSETICGVLADAGDKLGPSAREENAER